MTTTRHSQRLRQKIELLLPEMAEAGADLARHPGLRQLYPEILLNMHQGMRASVSLLKTAAARCHDLATGDPVAAALGPYFAEHVHEEDHAHWALEDLEVLGVSRAEALARMPSPAVASMVGAQYYWVLHHHPVAMLGDMMVREGYPSSPDAVEALMAATGYPRSAFRTMERHSKLDLHHRDDLIAMMDALPLTDEHHEVMGVSALHTAEMVIRANRELLERPAKVRA